MAQPKKPKRKDVGFPRIKLSKKGLKEALELDLSAAQLQKTGVEKIHKLEGVKDPELRKLGRYYGGISGARVRTAKTARRVHWPASDPKTGRTGYGGKGLTVGRGVHLPYQADIRAGSLEKGRQLRKEFKKAERKLAVKEYLGRGGQPGPGQTGRAVSERGARAYARQAEVRTGRAVVMPRSERAMTSEHGFKSIRMGTFPKTKFKAGTVPTTAENIKRTTEAGTRLRRERSRQAMQSRIREGRRPSISLSGTKTTASTVPTKSTLLEALWKAEGNEGKVRSDLKEGRLQLTGNFKGREAEVAGVKKPVTGRGIRMSEAFGRVAKAAKVAAPVIKTGAKIAGGAGLILSIPAQARGYTEAAGQISKGQYRKGIATALQTVTGTRSVAKKKRKPPSWVQQPR